MPLLGNLKWSISFPLTVTPSNTFENCPKIDLLFVPGAGDGLIPAIGDADLHKFLRRKARTDWLVLMPNAHEGYVSWERAEAIRKMVSSNVPTGQHHGAPKHGDALLAGLIRCKRCGRKLTLKYTGAKHGIPRYSWLPEIWRGMRGTACF